MRKNIFYESGLIDRSVLLEESNTFNSGINMKSTPTIDMTQFPLKCPGCKKQVVLMLPVTKREHKHTCGAVLVI